MAFDALACSKSAWRAEPGLCDSDARDQGVRSAMSGLVDLS